MKIHRSTQFESAKTEILQLYSELDCEPNNTLERTFICGPNDEVILSTKNMEYIEKMLARLQVRILLIYRCHYILMHTNNTFGCYFEFCTLLIFFIF